MKRLGISVIFFLATLISLTALPEWQAQGKAAAATLEKWQNEEPVEATRYVHVLYWTPSDREPAADYEERLTRITKHIQAFYGKNMKSLGLGEKTFSLDENDGQVVVHVIKGQKPTSEYGLDSGQEIRKECLPVMKEKGLNIDQETVLLFCNLASWDAEKLIFSHKSPYYAGGNHARGTAWQLDSPELDIPNLKLKEPIITDGQYGKISLGKHNSIFIGGIAHELGHALGLPHCRECAADFETYGNALMGSGNRSYGDELRGEGKGSYLSLAHGLRLASHPLFSGSVKEMSQAPKAQLETEITPDGKSLKVSGKVTEANPPVYAVVAYFDPEGHSDYDARTATAIPDAEGNFTLVGDELPAGKKGELRLFPLHVNGAVQGGMSRTPFRTAYEVDADGTPRVILE